MIQWDDVEAASHQFHIGPNDSDLGPVTFETDVFEVRSRLLIVHTGIASGSVRVGVERLEEQPGRPTPEWENVAEVTLGANAAFRVLTVDGDVCDELDALDFAHDSVATFRVCTRGRSAQWGKTVESSSETYLVQAWPSPYSSTICARQLRSTDGRWATTTNHLTTSDPDPGAGTEDATARLFGPQRWRG